MAISTLVPVKKRTPDTSKAVSDYNYMDDSPLFDANTLQNDDNFGFLIAIPASNIVPNRFQPRKHFEPSALKQLAESIRQYGILQPISVRRLEQADPPKYEIICGERRFRAGIMAGVDVFRCHLLQEHDMRLAELSLVENLLRDDLDIFEQAEAFQLLTITFGLTQQQVANRLGISQSAVANKLRLLKFRQSERDEILKNCLTERHARALLRLDDPEIRLKFINLISKDSLNVASTEQLIEKYIKYTSSREFEGNLNTAKRQNKCTTTGCLHDVRLFSNSIEKAADILRNSGICVETSCSEAHDSFIYTIKVSKKHTNQ